MEQLNTLAIQFCLGPIWFEALQHIEGDQGGRTIIRGVGQNFVEYVSIIPELGI